MSALVFLGIVLALAVALLLWAISVYNRLVSMSRKRDEAWSGVLVQLKRRHDLVPNLVGVVQGYAMHEKTVLEDVAKMRAFGYAGSPAEVGAVGEAERAFSQSLAKLLAIAENYPTLKADANFRDLQASLAAIEDDIQMSRRYYNGTVRNYNTLVASFPSMLVARKYAFAESPYFDLDSPGEAAVPKVSFAGGV